MQPAAQLGCRQRQAPLPRCPNGWPSACLASSRRQGERGQPSLGPSTWPLHSAPQPLACCCCCRVHHAADAAVVPAGADRPRGGGASQRPSVVLQRAGCDGGARGLRARPAGADQRAQGRVPGLPDRPGSARWVAAPGPATLGRRLRMPGQLWSWACGPALGLAARAGAQLGLAAVCRTCGSL